MCGSAGAAYGCTYYRHTDIDRTSLGARRGSRTVCVAVGPTRAHGRRCRTGRQDTGQRTQDPGCRRARMRLGGVGNGKQSKAKHRTAQHPHSTAQHSTANAKQLPSDLADVLQASTCVGAAAESPTHSATQRSALRASEGAPSGIHGRQGSIGGRDARIRTQAGMVAGLAAWTAWRSTRPSQRDRRPRRDTTGRRSARRDQ